FGIGLLTGVVFLAPPPPASLLCQIQSRGYILVGTSADYPPFEDYDATTDEFFGFDIDLSQMIADALGVTLEMQDMDFDALIGACAAGTIDMVAAAMTYTAERAAQLAASEVYITVTQVVIVRGDSTLTISDLSDLSGYDVGCQSGTVMQDELEDAGLTPTTFPRADVLIQSLVVGDIDAAYVDGPIFDTWSKTEDLKVIYSTDSEPLVLWCPIGEPELLAMIDKVILDAFEDGTMDDLYIEWFG
ncbi:MAG: transporter substrate-binding domain-containing protein, partial [Candidatus Hodarchaeota archaeon]